MSRRVPEGPPPPPAVQKLRVHYARRGRLRFSSTRDFARALERALRRAGVPMAFSAGFHPHPKISYAGGAPTGTASEAEYFEISVTEQVDPDAVARALDAALPDGLDVVSVVDAQPGALADRLEASRWRLEFAGLEPQQLEAALTAYLAEDVVEVTRTFKRGPRTFDTRAAVLQTGLRDEGSRAGDPPCAILEMVVRHTTPAVRPDDIVTAIIAVSSLSLPRTPTVTRLAQGPWRDETGTIGDPFAD